MLPRCINNNDRSLIGICYYLMSAIYYHTNRGDAKSQDQYLRPRTKFLEQKLLEEFIKLKASIVHFNNKLSNLFKETATF